MCLPQLYLRVGIIVLIEFSTLDNAILLFDWFTVFRLAANIPTFDLMCKLLQQMALGIKGFFSVVRQVSSTKKLHEPEKKEIQ